MIEANGLRKEYRRGASRIAALADVSFSAAAGEFVAITGPSGCGKSTLLMTLGGMLRPTRGTVTVNATDVYGGSTAATAAFRARNIGFVFQSYHLLDDLTVYENLEIPLSYRDVRRSERDSIVCDALDRFRIVGKKDLYPSQLSGGQQQLVAVARAVIASPKLILADEPTGNLHSAQGQEIMELFTKLNQDGTTIIQVTHSDVNASFGRRVIHLRDGWVVND